MFLGVIYIFTALSVCLSLTSTYHLLVHLFVWLVRLSGFLLYVPCILTVFWFGLAIHVLGRIIRNNTFGHCEITDQSAYLRCLSRVFGICQYTLNTELCDLRLCV